MKKRLYQLIRFRVRIAKGSQIVFGKNVKFGPGTFLSARGGRVSIGDNFRGNQDVIINADLGGSITIGKNCLFGPRVILRAANHKYMEKNKLISMQGHSIGEINIEDDVWIGANTVILPNVKIGIGAVVGASSVVTKNIGPYEVVAGNPARLIKTRN